MSKRVTNVERLRDLARRIEAVAREEKTAVHTPRTSPRLVPRSALSYGGLDCEPGCSGCARAGELYRAESALRKEYRNIEREIVAGVARAGAVKRASDAVIRAALANPRLKTNQQRADAVHLSLGAFNKRKAKLVP